jgi:uncharacterized OsmC-like protein
MSDESRRSIRLARLSHGRYRATNAGGATIDFGTDGQAEFTPVELLLAAISGCSAIDVDFITSKRSEPDRLDVTITADKVRDDGGNHLVDLVMTFDAAFPDTEGGRAASEVLPSAVQRSHDRLCTVSRTVELGTPVQVRIAGY